MNPFSYTLVNILLDIPPLLVALLGIILSFVYWRRYRRAPILTLIASLLFVLQSVVGIGLYGTIPLLMRRLSWRADSILIVMRLIHLLQSLILALSLGLFLAAVFGRREQTKTI